MRYPALIGSQADELPQQSLKPKAYPCPQGGTQGTRQRVMSRRLAPGAARPRRAWMVAAVGV
jgi:hypothetical protein